MQQTLTFAPFVSSQSYFNDLFTNEDYNSKLRKIKEVLDLSKISIFNDIVLIRVKEKLSDMEKSYIVKFINNTRSRSKYFIVLNNEILYVPKWKYMLNTESEIEFYLSDEIKKYKNDAMNKLLYKRYSKKYKSRILGKIVAWLVIRKKCIKNILY